MAVSLFELMQENSFNACSKVRENENGYAFVTLLSTSDIENPLNIYFGKKASENVAIDDRINPHNVFVYETTNADGELRWKISFKEGDAIETLQSMGYEIFGEIEKPDTIARPTLKLSTFVTKQERVALSMYQRIEKMLKGMVDSNKPISEIEAAIGKYKNQLESESAGNTQKLLDKFATPVLEKM